MSFEKEGVQMGEELGKFRDHVKNGWVLSLRI